MLYILDVHFISSLPVIQGNAYKAWVDSKPVRERSEMVRRGAHPRVDPGKIRLLAMEKTADGVHQLPQQATSKPSRVIGTVMRLLDQLTQSGVPSTPLSARGRSCG